MRACERRRIREHNERAWMVWHIAALPRMKRLPKIDKLMISDRASKPAQTWQEQDKIMEQWSAHMRRVEAGKKRPL